MYTMKEALNQLEETRSKSFIPYIMAGTNGLVSFKDELLFLQESNATMIEVGLPFSDPTADGPTIQVAGTGALKNGMTTKRILTFLQQIKAELTVPIIIMTYFNPVYQYGIEQFVADLKKANIAGCIIPDLPLEEEEIIVPYLNSAGIPFIRLVTVTNSDERLKKIIERSIDGFLYAVTVAGTTGGQSHFHSHLVSFLQKLKQMSTVPVFAGFNISTPDDVEEIIRHCDGVIVGSRIIQMFANGEKEKIIPLIQAVK